MLNSLRRRIAAPVSVALLALAAAAAGLRNGFTYDDRYIIELNPAAHDVAHWWRAFAASYWPRAWGGDGYRPLTSLLFRLEWGAGHGSPIPFHAANILLYAAVSVLVFFLARRILPPWAAWLSGALFAVHPVHVEAVANSVGQSELLVAAMLLPAIVLYIRDRQRGDLRLGTAVAIGACYAVACFAKEHGIVLPAILVAAELTVIRGGRSVRALLRDQRLRVFYLSLALVAVAFVAVRSIVLSDHPIGGFQPFTPFSALRIGALDRMLTAVGVVPEWVRLFLWPARLSSEYGPPAIEIAQGFDISQLPGFLLLGATLALGVVLRRRQAVISFGIAIVCISLLPSSNFILPAGIVLAERTLFLPSVGAMLVIGGSLAALLPHVARRLASDPERRNAGRIAIAAAGVVLALGLMKSVQRTRVWVSNAMLFRQAVVDSPDSYRAHYMLGAWYFEKAQKRIGESEYRRALSLFPYDPYLAYNAAEQYRAVGMCKPAIPLYQWSRGLDSNFTFGRAAYAGCLLELGSYDQARAMALEAIRAGGDLKQARRLIFLADSAKSADNRKAPVKAIGLAGLPSKVPESVQKTVGQTGKSPNG
jgi:protein O-mannosyl-transferase